MVSVLSKFSLLTLMLPYNQFVKVLLTKVVCVSVHNTACTRGLLVKHWCGSHEFLSCEINSSTCYLSAELLPYIMCVLCDVACVCVGQNIYLFSTVTQLPMKMPLRCTHQSDLTLSTLAPRMKRSYG